MTHPAMTPQQISVLIDESPMNRGAVGREWLAADGNMAFADENGNVVLFEKRSPHIYEFHWLRTLSMPKETIAFTRAAFREMYDFPGVGLIYGLVSDERRDVKLMARWIGAQPLGKVPTDYGLCEMFILPRAALEKE